MKLRKHIVGPNREKKYTVLNFIVVIFTDPNLLVSLKATRNSVPVPRHWCFKRKYLQGKRGIEKAAFDLPDFIKKTGIMEMRAALQEKEVEKNMDPLFN